jgi:hypothetical protein
MSRDVGLETSTPVTQRPPSSNWAVEATVLSAAALEAFDNCAAAGGGGRAETRRSDWRKTNPAPELPPGAGRGWPPTLPSAAFFFAFSLSRAPMVEVGLAAGLPGEGPGRPEGRDATGSALQASAGLAGLCWGGEWAGAAATHHASFSIILFLNLALRLLGAPPKAAPLLPMPPPAPTQLRVVAPGVPPKVPVHSTGDGGTGGLEPAAT